MWLLYRLLLLCLLSPLLAGCSSYRWGTELPLPLSFRLPFIEGDRDGLVTQLMIEEISARTPFVYDPCEGKYLFKMVLGKATTKNIGFRYERNMRGAIEENIIPTETRLSTGVELWIWDLTNGQKVVGPLWLGQAIDFDHAYYSSRDDINIFSLGQLTDYDAAEEAAWTPLVRRLAAEVSDYLAFTLLRQLSSTQPACP